MTRHFFGVETLTTDQDSRLRAVFDDSSPASGGAMGGGGEGREITPATVEQVAGEFDTVDTFIEALEALP